MKPTFCVVLWLAAICGFSQNLQVSTIVPDINASGGVTWGPDGNLYVSDFGPNFTTTDPTNVYRVNYGSWEVDTFAQGFAGASGSCFDAEGNFYQSNPIGKKISRLSAAGNLDLNWASEGFGLPVGIQQGVDGNFYVCDCNQNQIIKVTPEGVTSVFADSPEFACPNGLTVDPDGVLYACNFTDGKILKVTPEATVSVVTQIPQLTGGPNPVGAGHLTWKNDYLFVTAIGRGEVYKVDLDGNQELIAGIAFDFSNADGPASQATFSKPNGIVASTTGDTLFLNVSTPTWLNGPQDLHPAHLRMITGVCSLPDVDCPLLTANGAIGESEQPLFSVAPNPSHESVEVSFSPEMEGQLDELQLIDSLGKILRTIPVKALQSVTISLAEFPPGSYWLKAKTSTETFSRQLIVH